MAMRLAPYAAVTIAHMCACQATGDTADNLQAALLSRAVIDPAKGILMERHTLSADRAFVMLAQASMRTNTTLRDVADRLVTTGALVPCCRGPASGRCCACAAASARRQTSHRRTPFRPIAFTNRYQQVRQGLREDGPGNRGGQGRSRCRRRRWPRSGGRGTGRRTARWGGT